MLITDKNKNNILKMKAKTGFNIRNVCGQDLIVAEGEENIDFSNIISMNETSSYLWKKIQNRESFTVGDMADILIQEYDVDRPTAMADCEQLAVQWANAGIIEGCDIPDKGSSQNAKKSNHADGSSNNLQVEKQSEEYKLPQKKSFLKRLLHKN